MLFVSEEWLFHLVHGVEHCPWVTHQMNYLSYEVKCILTLQTRGLLYTSHLDISIADPVLNVMPAKSDCLLYLDPLVILWLFKPLLDPCTKFWWQHCEEMAPCQIQLKTSEMLFMSNVCLHCSNPLAARQTPLEVWTWLRAQNCTRYLRDLR